MEKNGGGFGENMHELEKNAKMLEKINTIIETIAELLGQRSGTAWAGWTGEHKHREFQSWRKLFNGCWQQQVRFTKKTNN